MFCWIFCIDLYGRLNWIYACRSDLKYSKKIGYNKIQSVESKEREDEP
jgi:hypothetical protein